VDLKVGGRHSFIFLEMTGRERRGKGAFSGTAKRVKMTKGEKVGPSRLKEGVKGARRPTSSDGLLRTRGRGMLEVSFSRNE